MAKIDLEKYGIIGATETAVRLAPGEVCLAILTITLLAFVAAGMTAIADDSGLCVDALQGGPGVYSARYGGEGLDDAGRYRLLLQNMRGQTDRSAKFVSVITCCFPNGDVITARGECPGTIAFAPMGEGGFGYDPVFFVPALKKTFSQLSAEEKNAISHRGKALEIFRGKLEEYMK